MRIKVYKNTLLTIILFGLLQANAQKKFDLDLKETSMDLEGKSLTGYVISFDFLREEVRKGWWKYARQFGNPMDMRTYYEVRIPAQTTDGNVDLTIYAQTFEEGGNTFFKLGLEEEKYKVQVEELIKVFKKDFYIKYYLGKIRLVEIEAEKYSNQYTSAIPEDEKAKILNSLNSKKQEMELLKEEIRKVEGKE